MTNDTPIPKPCPDCNRAMAPVGESAGWHCADCSTYWSPATPPAPDAGAPRTVSFEDDLFDQMNDREFFRLFREQQAKTRRDEISAAYDFALDEVLACIDREQNYREFREDQDGSGVGACKEIAGYVRALKAKGMP